MSTKLSLLCRTNISILRQKETILNKLEEKHGFIHAQTIFQKICPVVGSSIGQHLRHSMDHVELTSLVASSLCSGRKDETKPFLHYDHRVRGGTLEKDINLARSRIMSVIQVLTDLNFEQDDIDSEEMERVMHPVRVSFIFSADNKTEVDLNSTVERELGFVAHHAIHHLAMVKIIAIQTGGLKVEDLPNDFGRAPSTVQFDQN